MRMRWNEIVLSFPFRPTPSRQLSSVCLLELIPRPRAREERASGRFAAAGGMPICVLPAMSCRSLANARSLLLLYSSCGAVPSVSYRMICLDCLIGLVPRSPVFSIKAFQWTRCPAALSIAVSWRLRSPSSRSSSRRAASPASLADVLPALPSHCLRPVIISCRRLVIQFPRLATCLARRLCPIRHLSCHLGQFCLRPASRLASRSVLPWDVIAVLPDYSPCRSACSHQSPRPACRLAGSRTGRVRLSRHRLPALPPLLVQGGVSPACVSSLRSALLACVPPFVSVL